MSNLLPLRVLVVDADAGSQEQLTSQLTALGFAVVPRSAEPVVPPLSPDVALIDLNAHGDVSAIAMVHEIRESLPNIAIVLCTADASLQLLPEDAEHSHATALLLKPIPDNVLEASLRLAVLRAQELARVQEECAQAIAQLEARKLIERAKGILMRRTGSSEQEAYRIMQRTSQDKSVPMVNIARTVIASEPGVRSA